LNQFDEPQSHRLRWVRLALGYPNTF
jgi:hypothetical protein